MALLSLIYFTVYSLFIRSIETLSVFFPYIIVLFRISVFNMSAKREDTRLVGAIDVGTGSSRFLVSLQDDRTLCYIRHISSLCSYLTIASS